MRASSRVSPGFALFRHSSPFIGSQQVRSHTNPTTVWTGIGRRCAPSAEALGFTPRWAPGLASAFTVPRSLPPKDSRMCFTPWSMFQDGSDATIRTPTTSVRVVVPLRPEREKPCANTGEQWNASASKPTWGRSRSPGGSARPARAKDRKRSPRSPFPDCVAPGLYAPRRSEATSPERPLSRKQPPLAGFSRKCSANDENREP